MGKEHLHLVYFFFFILCAASAKQVSAQRDSATININLQNASIDELAKQIELQSDYRLYYDRPLFDSIRITASVSNSTPEAILKQAFSGTEFNYSIYGNSIFLTKGEQIMVVLPSQYSGETPNNVSAPKVQVADLAAPEQRVISTLENKIYTIGVNTNSQKTNATIAGYVKHSTSGEPLSGVAVFITKPRITAVTDAYGFYSLTLPKGRHELNLRAVSFKDTRRYILLLGDGKLDIGLQDQLLSLKEVVITADKTANIRRTQMGIEKLDIATIKQVPTVFGEADVLRVVLTLPGVKSVGESSTGFNVRGGSTDQNLILFNDATVFNPAHFFGFFSAFNPEVIKDVQLYKSSIPAKYGGRLASVLELNTREGNKKEYSGTAGIGLITSRLNFEGPIIKDKTSFIVGGRTTYSNWIMDLLPEKAGYRGAKASFYDLNLNVSHQQNERNSFYFTAYLSSDQSNLATDTTFRYSNQNLSLRWKHTFNNKLYSVVSGGVDKYEYNNYSNYLEEVDYSMKFSIQQNNLKATFNYYPTPKLNMEFGGSSILYKSKPGALLPYNERSLVVPDVLANEQAIESAIFVEPRYDLSDAITLNAGLRYSMYNNMGPGKVNFYAPGLPVTDANMVSTESYPKGKFIKTYHGPEFRLGARIALSPTFSVKAGYNTQRQYVHMLSNTTSMSPTDVWKLSDMNIKPQRGDQVSLGLYKNFKSNTIETSVEGYYKNIKDFLDYKSGAVLILNHKLEQDVLPTQGKAYGIEFLVKKLTGKLNGWLGYTYSRTLLKTEDITGTNSINGGKYYASNYDKPHDFTLIGNYRFSHRVSFSLNTTYSTGRPITLPVGRYFYKGGQRLLYSERNQYRIPDYFRSDISLNVLGNHKVRQLTHNSWTFGVYNLTGRKNAFASFFASENKVINGYKLSIFGTAIPFVNYNIRFK
ncbi:carboxypeptidase-like regulatory domain-containing protein [Paradesertivirga mongoliensis]|uniref:Carboxypeptidase-like regulatory domain-containing protein n=1 Tax=Paradesertivirga mongoliensis TaxID=2100740 RepID=A0ABW4ZKY7_9SPHI|nr:carboxypeptidase-like regulatory domain-containing protein [Pedobacter mongoliensis]